MLAAPESEFAGPDAAEISATGKTTPEKRHKKSEHYLGKNERIYDLTNS